MKIVVLDGYTLTPEPAAWTPLAALGDVEVHDRSSTEEIRERSRNATVLITNKARISADVIREAPALRFVAVTATGFDGVDVTAAGERGIAVSNVPEYSTRSVAQLVFALTLELCHHVGQHSEAVHAGAWTRSKDFSFALTPTVELAGKTMGIVGFGRIGRRVGELAHAFGMSVLASSRSRGGAAPYSPFDWASVDDLFGRADVISLHCPLGPETAGLVGSRRLSLVKPTAFLINTARGGLVVEADLAAALEAGTLAGAAVDVVSEEPIRADNPLLAAPRCIITPHFAWATREARERLLAATIANVEAFAQGHAVNVVNAPSTLPR